MLSASVILAWLLAAVDVGGSSTCPSPTEVAARLEALLPPDDVSVHHGAAIEPFEGGVRIVFLAPDGTALVERSISARASSCEELADTCAVVLAAWEADLRSGAWGLLPKAPEEPRRLAVEVGALASLAGTQLAPGGLVAVEAGPGGSRWGARLSVALAAPREFALGSGQVQWLRGTAALGARYRIGGEGIHFELIAEVLASLLSLRGTGYAENGSALGFEPGLGGGARVVFPRGQWALLTELSANGWIRAQHALVDGLEGQGTLPGFELTLRVGAALGFL